MVAHADDDLYFMNPEVAQTVRSGATIVTVYLTAGESDGRNVFKDAPNAAKTTADRPGFAAARQYGARGAYAKMATGNRAAAWKRETIATADGAVAEIDTLVDAPRVQLVWLSIKEAWRHPGADAQQPAQPVGRAPSPTSRRCRPSTARSPRRTGTRARDSSPRWST
ncbi:hypothetical protein ACU686_21440 [Yinghuangia aomiensis]